MKSIADNIENVRSEIAIACEKSRRAPQDVQLLAVSKTRSADEIREAATAGLSAFGENYLQEALEKIEALEDLNLEWHFIGPIQSNKTRPIAEHFDWVHSVDRLKIAQRLSDQRPFHSPDLNLCIQVNVSGEESKSGCSASELSELARAIARLPKIRLRGLMAIPEPTDDLDLQHQRFKEVRALFDQLRAELPELDTLSMGMSADLEPAIEEGATIVRIGTALFGPRNYKN